MSSMPAPSAALLEEVEDVVAGEGHGSELLVCYCLLEHKLDYQIADGFVLERKNSLNL